MRLGLNSDHIATLRNARGGIEPDVIEAALIAQKCGVDGITTHLREDRRHIKDEDVFKITIKNKDQPLLIVKGKQPQGKNIDLYFIPELCTLTGLDEDVTKDNSIEEDNIIENKNVRIEISESKTVIKDLFKSANSLEKKKISELKESENLDSTKVKEKANSVIDKFKGIFKSDELYVIKLVVNEGINALKIINPDKVNVKIKYGSSDPYFTGLLFSIAAPIYSIMGDDLNLKINSDKDFTESFMTLVGHPRLYKLMGSILRLLMNKKFRKVVFKKKK